MHGKKHIFIGSCRRKTHTHTHSAMKRHYELQKKMKKKKINEYIVCWHTKKKNNKKVKEKWQVDDIH